MKAYMKVYMKAIIFALCFIMFWISPDAQAAYNDDLVSGTLNLDLNKGKASADVWLSRDTNKLAVSYTLHISDAMGNEASIANITNASLNDIDSRDKYIEIVTCSSAKKRLTIYRWNGKKPVVYVSAALTPELTKLSGKNYCYAPGYYVLGCEGNGKGRLTVKVAMIIRDDPCILDLNYKISNGCLQFENSSYAEVDKGLRIKGSQAGKAWTAYQYPRMTSNRKVFTLSKGEKVRTLKLKITRQYTFMQVKRMKNNQTGWVVFLTKDIDKGNRNFNPYK